MIEIIKSDSNTTLVKVKSTFNLGGSLPVKNSNTTLVKVKFYKNINGNHYLKFKYNSC